MRRRTGSRRTEEARATRGKRLSPAEAVALVNGMTTGLGGLYLLTSSALITALAAVPAVVVTVSSLLFEK
ncbi:hypothetical protein AB0B50_00475 [Streptomyces sp. NPDC041068]|uniref:hypothetical protein n=1 Tax=Streptomyces sp. NPDC041068 TaxID=3155130 RepID=UPI00340500B7